LGVGKNKRSVARCRSDAGKSIPEMMRRKITGGSDARKNIRGSDAGAYAPGGKNQRKRASKLRLSEDLFFVLG